MCGQGLCVKQLRMAPRLHLLHEHETQSQEMGSRCRGSPPLGLRYRSSFQLRKLGCKANLVVFRSPRLSQLIVDRTLVKLMLLLRQGSMKLLNICSEE